MTEAALLSIRNLQKRYRTRHGIIRAVEDVSIDIAPGETVAVVGESGCGKSTLAHSILGLVQSNGGTISINGGDAHSLPRRPGQRKDLRVGVVFQNPHSSLNPKMRVFNLVAEPLVSVLALRSKDLREAVEKQLTAVGLGEEHMRRYPHELSGGQMQRVAIARALALQPRLLILDEPTAALDVSVQAQILKLLKSLQDESGVSFLYITHDLASVQFMAQRVYVMYLGRVVESGQVSAVFSAPTHPYTRALLDAVPSLDPARRRCFAVLNGEIPSLLNRPSGCAFSPRCVWSTDICNSLEPELAAGNDGHMYACHRPLRRYEEANVGDAAE